MIDTHVHVGLRNYVPVEELLTRMEAVGIDKAVLVQYRANTPPPGNTDNKYIAHCIKKYSTTFAAVCIVDHNHEDASDTLEYWVKEHGIQGIRLMGTDRSPANAWAIWEKAAELRVNVSVSGNILPIKDIAPRLPSLNILVEHTGIPKVNGEQVIELAKYPNIFVKFTTGGLAAISHQPYPFHDVQPFFKRVYTVFGPDRIMWGSDYPPVENREGLAKALDFIKKEVKWLSENDKAWLLQKTAMKVWKFN